ncbi:hypothetical protein ACVDFE_02260 [Lentzea chajnantorensis]
MGVKQMRADLVTLGAAVALSALDWWIDRQPTERVAGLLRLAVLAACVAAVLFAGGCHDTDGGEGVSGVLSPPTATVFPSAFVLVPAEAGR